MSQSNQTALSAANDRKKTSAGCCRLLRKNVVGLIVITAIALSPFTISTRAQAQAAKSPAVDAIQDNSFFIEEAYNQEPGVIQEINTFTRLQNSNVWAYTFTNEYPVPFHWKHQLSYTLVESKPDSHLPAGFGDILLNYRYQIVGTGESRLAIAPRLSAILPTGSYQKATGYGGAGLQSVLPVSYVLSRSVVTHSNLGGTWIPSARDVAGDKAASYGYYAGQSLIWLARPRFNFMLESLWTSTRAVSGPNTTQQSNSLILVPGVRWAHNLSHGLQIVPGAGFSAGAGPSSGQNGVFIYLSFEHPAWRDAAE